MSMFSKATKSQAKARIAMHGPAGSGKTYTALEWATVLANGGRVAVIDTERASASLYADKFDFDVVSFAPPYHPDRLITVLDEAAKEGYDAVVIDSLSHFWSGAGGVLEIVDEAKSRFKGNTYAAWQVGTPLQQKMIDRILSHPAHVIATMRSKTDWQVDSDNGRVTPVKIGLAPQQRDGVEYEFTLVLDIDVKHRASVSKSRFAGIADRTFSPDETKQAATQVLNWLTDGKDAPTETFTFVESSAEQVEPDENVVNEFKQTIRKKIGELPEHKRDTLKALWDAKGLPKLDNLTKADLSQVEELFALAD